MTTGPELRASKSRLPGRARPAGRISVALRYSLAQEEPSACGSKTPFGALDQSGFEPRPTRGRKWERAWRAERSPALPTARQGERPTADVPAPPAEVNRVGGPSSETAPDHRSCRPEGRGGAWRDPNKPHVAGAGPPRGVTARACAGAISRRRTLVGAVKRGRSRAPAFPGTFCSLRPAPFPSPSPFPVFWRRDLPQLLWLLPRCRPGAADRGARGGP